MAIMSNPVHFVDVMPLQDPLPNDHAELRVPGEKPLMVSMDDYNRFVEMCSADLIGRTVTMSAAPDGIHIRFELVLQ
jgi:hypothetical protein